MLDTRPRRLGRGREAGAHWACRAARRARGDTAAAAGRTRLCAQTCRSTSGATTGPPARSERHFGRAARVTQPASQPSHYCLVCRCGARAPLSRVAGRLALRAIIGLWWAVGGVGGQHAGSAPHRQRPARAARVLLRLLVADGGHCTIEHTRPVKPDLAMRAGRQEITPYGRVPAAACAHRVACRTGAGSSLVQLARTTAGFARHDCSALAALRSHQSRSSRARQR
jgi:hypothetical protein